MGCDIHFVVEKKIGDKWVGITTSEVYPTPNCSNFVWRPYAASRNYIRFAALAGVRGDGPNKRGVPDDISDLSEYWIDYWDSDGHSHSWGTIEEVVHIFKTAIHPLCKEVRIDDDDWFGCDSSDPDIRVVYWFDN